MTPVQTIEAICRFFERELVNLRPDGQSADGKSSMEKSLTIYPYGFPEPAPTQMTKNVGRGESFASYERMMPAVAVVPVSYEDKVLEDGTSLLTVSIMAGVFSKDRMNQEGPWAVMNILERIRRLLLTHRILEDACEVQEPLSWQLYDETTKPLWLGEMITQWRIFVPDRVDSDDWRGDFIFKGRDAMSAPKE